MNLIPDDPTMKHSEPPFPESAPMVEPFFWGTGDLLVWNPSEVLETIDRPYLFKSVWGRDCLSEKQYASMSATTFTPLFETLRTQIVESSLIDPRGFYGYFPVITDDRDCILLDPSDFHSELCTITFPAKNPGGGSINDYLRPQGDCIALSAVTLGKHLEPAISRLTDDPDRKGYYLEGMGTALTHLLQKKITAEIRRGLSITDQTGNAVILECVSGNYNDILPEIFEIMSIEERLAILCDGSGSISPRFSSIQLFIHHPSFQY